MNVVVVLLDTLRPDHLGCYGNDWIKTPNIDKLAAEGTVFERAYSEGLPTLPFRCSAFTGKYTLARRGWGPLNPKDKVIAETLWDKGIKSALISDVFHMHQPPHTNFARGFDYVEWIRGNEGDAYRTDPKIEAKFNLFETAKSIRPLAARPLEIVIHRYERYLRNISKWVDEWFENDSNHFVAQNCKAAMNWLERQEDRDNLFLWLDCFDPHEPWDPPKEFQDLYRITEYSGPPMCWFGGFADVLSDTEVSHIRSLYAANVSLCDKWVGLLMDKIIQLDMMDNTIIMLVSDHGIFLGERDLFLKECRWPYEELARISLVIRHPQDIGKGKRVKAFVDTTDLMPTILECFEVMGPNAKEVAFEATDFIPGASPDGIEGQSLLPLMAGEKEKIREFAVSGFFNASWRIRNDDWSFHMWAPEERSDRPRPELYRIPSAIKCPSPTEFNRKEDWLEKENVIEQYPEVAEKMELQLRRFLNEFSDNKADFYSKKSAVGYFWSPV